MQDSYLEVTVFREPFPAGFGLEKYIDETLERAWLLALFEAARKKAGR